MLGYPGAGKTTAAEVINKITGAEHISSDKARTKMFPHPSFNEAEHTQLYRALDKETEQLLAAGNDVIYDANLNRHRHRMDKYDICNRTGAKSVLVWVQTPKELAKSRAVHHSRSHLVPTEETPHDMFERIAAVIEPPHANEPFITVDGTKITPEYIAEQLGL